MVHDLNTTPLPFSDGQFQEILAQDVLEHLEYPTLLRDLHRILAVGGKLTIRSPHFTSRNNFVDPTHKKLFTCDTLDFFVKDSSFSKSAEREYYFDFHFSKTEKVYIRFPRWSRWFFLNGIIEKSINKTRRSQRIYEASGLSRLFPAENIEVTLVK